MSADVVWLAWRNDGCRAVFGLDCAARVITMNVVDPHAPRRTAYELNAAEARRYIGKLRRSGDPEAESLACVVEAQLQRLKALPRCA